MSFTMLHCKPIMSVFISLFSYHYAPSSPPC
uniref:Uncharacterized protein n=1 Tax=Anguilla anguilla TaxID=7936 RepID=A0A0E9P5T1_ANGAN